MGDDLVGVDLVHDAEGAGAGDVVGNHLAGGLGEIFSVHEVGHADAAAASLVLIAGANAAECGADGHFAGHGLGDFFHQAVRRQQDLRAVADLQPEVDVDAGGSELFGFLKQCQRVNDESVADDGGFAVAENAAGHQPEDELAVPDPDGVAGVVASLVPNDVVEATGQHVDQLALALVTPLCAQNYDVAHASCSFALLSPKPPIIPYGAKLLFLWGLGVGDGVRDFRIYAVHNRHHDTAKNQAVIRISRAKVEALAFVQPPEW